ncbi:MAG: PLxRFG domain-containing protein, partial [Vogesella sp.]|uniref:PLxRFG domain-containing protein n=1 Tax=Vogesella sp. TaxID=1904252 RepID=UPI003F2DD376
LDLVRGGAGPQAPGRSGVTRAVQWVGRYSGWFNHISEAANRQVTAIAGYKLALGQGMNRDQAVDYVAKLLDESQFNYAFSNRPRLLMSNAGRVIGLMHTFAINAMYRIGRNLYHAMGSWKTEEGREARSIMLRILTVQMALAGLSSLPMLPLAGAAVGTAAHKATGSRVLGAAGVIAGVGLAQALVAGMGADDDEPWDFDAERRRILNDITGSRTIAELLDKGLLRSLGMDVANRISMNDLLMRDVDTGFTSKPAQAWLDNAFLQSIGGAAYGAIKQYARATDMAMDGQYHRAVEAALPKFAADILKASRYAREDVRVPVGPASAHKADVTAFDVARQAIGFTPSTVAEVNSNERAQRKAVAQMQARRGELLEAWVVARLEKNADAEKSAAERIAKFNQTQRDNGSVDLVITGADRVSKLRSQKRSVERREQG